MRRRVQFKNRWFSVWLPEDWHYQYTPDGGVFQREASGGALQIGAVRAGKEVNADDLRELVREEFPGLEPVCGSWGGFFGFHRRWARGGVRWLRWWLGCGELVVVASYVGEEEETVEEIVETLRARGVAG